MVFSDLSHSSLEDIHGEKGDEQIGVVTGNTVRARNAGQDMKAALSNITGGEVSQYSELLSEARRSNR